MQYRRRDPNSFRADAMAMLTVRQIDRADKEWLQQEAARQQLSMEELVRRLIHEKRQQSMEQRSPSAIVRRHFGPQKGIDLGERRRFGFDVPTFQDTEAP
jgi:Rps23 Pro-64 3,4-dihydroxylase Tpa1-like proline 4-hydroxylase